MVWPWPIEGISITRLSILMTFLYCVFFLFACLSPCSTYHFYKVFKRHNKDNIIYASLFILCMDVYLQLTVFIYTCNVNLVHCGNHIGSHIGIIVP